jgi:hypothetical protein
MRGRFRFALAGGSVLLVLTVAGSAFGAYSPKITTTTAPDSITVAYRQADSDDASAALTFFAPPGMQADLSGAVGATIGEARATVDIAGATTAATGTVLVANPADPTIAAFTTACTGTSTHDAVWDLHTTISDVAIDIPASVDKVTGPAAAFASYEIRVCFRSPYIPPAQGGQPNGVKPIEASLTLNGVFTPPAASELPWTGLFIPWAVGTGNLNIGAAAESQAIASYPVQLRLTGKDVVTTRVVGRGRHRHRVSTHRARIVGKLTSGGEGEAGAPYVLFAGRKRIAAGTTNGNGGFTKTIRLTKTTVFRATVARAPQDVTGGTCNPIVAIHTPGGPINPTCTGITAAGIAASSNAVTVRKKQPKKKR